MAALIIALAWFAALGMAARGKDVILSAAARAIVKTLDASAKGDSRSPDCEDTSRQALRRPSSACEPACAPISG